MRLAGACFLVAVAAIAVLFPGCAGGNHDQAGDSICASEPPEITAKRVAAYNGTVKALLGGKVCSSCHGGTGSSAPYLYLSGDDAQALGIATTLAKFDNISDSRFVKKILSDHNCGSHSQCVTLSQEVTNSIKSWADQVSSLPSYTCESGQRVVLSSVQMKTSDLSLTTDKVLRWDVGSVVPNLGKIWFRINAKLVVAPGAAMGAYKLSAPRMASSDKKIHVKDFRILIESLVSTNALNFVDVDFVLDVVNFNPTASAWNVPKLSESTQLVSFNDNQNLGFSFLIEESTDAATVVDDTLRCRVPELFQQVVDNVFEGPSAVMGETGQKCLRCHGDSNNAAYTAMPLSGSLDAVCLEALLRVDLTIAGTNNASDQSTLYLKPHTQLPNHPVKEVFTTTQRDFLRAWVNAEKTASGL